MEEKSLGSVRRHSKSPFHLARVTIYPRCIEEQIGGTMKKSNEAIRPQAPTWITLINNKRNELHLGSLAFPKLP